MVSPIIIAVSVLAIFIILDTLNSLYSDIFIFIFFLFAYINIEGSTSLSTFYLLSFFFYFIIRIGKVSWQVKNKGFTKELYGIKTKGNIPLLGIGLGIIIFIAMRLLQSTTAGSIVGVPSLAITSPAFTISTVMLLGVIENRLFFTLFELFKEGHILKAVSGIPILREVTLFLRPIMPVFMASGLFMLFHITAFSLATSSLIFSFIVFMIWIASYILSKDDLAPNLAHMLWNLSVSLNRVMGIAF